VTEGEHLERRLVEAVGAQQALVVLDNFEQLLPAAPLVGELLQAAPRLRVLATSRTPLRVYGEQVLPVPPLPEREAGALFVERARAVGGMVLAGHAVAQICARLDRLPLGIELVAARSAELTEAELVASLARRLELASQGPRDLPERQQTLRAAIGWSHELLSAPARELFAELGAFAGGF
jgi:predicted ATPase